QGRYYTMILGLSYVALTCMILSLALQRVQRVDGQTKRVEYWSRWGCVGLLALVAVGLTAQRGLPNFRLPTADNSARQVLRDVSSQNAAAIMGDYWVIWILQFFANQEASGGVPNITPIAIRSEAFSLKVFAPILRSIAANDSFGIACVTKVG